MAPWMRHALILCVSLVCSCLKLWAETGQQEILSWDWEQETSCQGSDDLKGQAALDIVHASSWQPVLKSRERMPFSPQCSYGQWHDPLFIGLPSAGAEFLPPTSGFSESPLPTCLSSMGMIFLSWVTEECGERSWRVWGGQR